jgi:hypothetical protein
VDVPVPKDPVLGSVDVPVPKDSVLKAALKDRVIKLQADVANLEAKLAGYSTTVRL